MQRGQLADLMFDGGRNGTSVIPYSVDNSYMLYSVNTDSTQGPVLLPTMPYLQAPLLGVIRQLGIARFIQILRVHTIQQ